MKTIFFTLRPPAGSYGGGAFFVKDMANYLEKNGYNVVYDLQPNIDIIFVVDPRKDTINRYGIDDIILYKNIYPTTKVLYAVNECDIKRIVSINLEPLIVRAILVCDYIVFISHWLKDYYLTKYAIIKSKFNDETNNSTVINNACCPKIYYPLENKLLNKEKIKIVTHHWSDNYYKGFYIYNKLAVYLRNNSHRYEFTYIGRYNGIPPSNINYIPPISGNELANELRKHDIYLTASLYEPGGIHQLEGMSCGLPILYRENSGGVKETIFGAGEEYNDLDDMLEKLEKIVNNYDYYRSRINYEFMSSQRFGQEYLSYFNNNLLKN